MALTKRVHPSAKKEQKAKEQQIEALHKNLTAADQEKICEDHGISRATYYRIIRAFDLTSPLMLAIVQVAEANKLKADERAARGAAALKNLV